MKSENVEIAARVLSEWAQAIRGDWSSIDGRQCQDELDSIVFAMETDGIVFIAELRSLANVCRQGHGFWEGECDFCGMGPQ